MDIEKPRVDNVLVQWPFKKNLNGTLFISPLSLELWIFTPESLPKDTTKIVPTPQEFIRLV